MAGIMRVDVRFEGLPHAWVLDHHYDHAAGSRTTAGQLVYLAKPYGQEKRSDPAAVQELARLMSEAARSAPRSLLEVDAVMGVPAYPTKLGPNLPDALAELIAEASGLRWEPGLVEKVKATPEMKRMPDAEKWFALAGAFRFSTDSVLGVPRRVLLIDDLLYSGHTLAAVTAALRRGGVEEVVGFAATKVKKGMGSSD